MPAGCPLLPLNYPSFGVFRVMGTRFPPNFLQAFYYLWILMIPLSEMHTENHAFRNRSDSRVARSPRSP